MRACRAALADDEIGMRIHGSAAEIDEAGARDERFAAVQCDLDAIPRRLDGEREASDGVRGRTLALTGVHIDHFDEPIRQRIRTFRAAYRAADRSSALSRGAH